ncbi:hypothetical protein [Streptomyces sp. gCLA4]|uniref:hypothetical protein n=1 Tax=Streptomyces sp. gCLA4 TaxID=1873416 RepID=UPI001602945E|nr:hypothetical protein [Streptomyces sp. gCLA4]
MSGSTTPVGRAFNRFDTATGEYPRKLRELVEEGRGSAVVTVRTLRDLYGNARTGRHVAAGIAAGIKAAKIRSLPREIPGDQDRKVLLYDHMNGAPNLLVDLVVRTMEGEYGNEGIDATGDLLDWFKDHGSAG